MSRPECPTAAKIFAVGDIHGCFDKLSALIDRLPLDRRRDRLIFLGDYINRGPQSREVIDYLLELRAACPLSVFLMGNHEHLLLRYAATGDLVILNNLRRLGVEATLRSYGDAPVRSLLDLSFLPPTHRAFLEQLVLHYRCGPYLFTHAGSDAAAFAEQPVDVVLSSRKSALPDEADGEEIVVFGHIAFATPFVTPSRIGIDSGAVYGNMLTAVELPQGRFYHA